MARTSAQINADIAAIHALPAGVRTITFQDGRSASYYSEEEKRDALARLTSELASASDVTTTRRRQIRLSSSKGLD